MKRPSMVFAIIGWQVALMCLSWVLLVAWLFQAMTSFENGDLDRRMNYFAEILAETASGAIDDPALLARRLRATEKTYVEGVIESLENATEYHATYQVIDSLGNLAFRRGPAPEVPLTTVRGISKSERSDGQTWRMARVRSSDGSVDVIVAESEASRWQSVWPMLRIIGAAQMLILLTSLLVLWWAAKRGVAPLRALADAIAKRRTGDALPIDSPVVYAEIAPIVDELNALLAREARQLERERGFLADAAHELRTPLAAIGTQAHLLLGAEGQAERERFATELRAGVERVSHLLSQLLTIARVDAPGTEFPLERIDAAAVLRERLADLSASARARSISLALKSPESVPATLNRWGMVSIIDNVVGNAIRYTPSGGNVEVELAPDVDDLVFRVRDDGPGIAAHERERVFERFYRIPGVLAQGSGLGLAIVRRLADAHGASVKLADGLAGKGVGVIVTLRGCIDRTSQIFDGAKVK